MKTKVAVFVLLLATLCFPTDLTAQTKKPTKKKTPAVVPQSDAPDKTRSRRTSQTTPPATSPETQTPAASGDTTTKGAPTKTDVPTTVIPVMGVIGAGDQTAKPVETPEATPTPAGAKPEAAAEEKPLRDQIDAPKTAAERIHQQLKLVEELINTGKKADAVTMLHSIADTDVFDPQSFYNVGNSFARLGETDGAIQAYRKAIEQRKGRYSRALNNLGVVMLRSGRWDEAYDALTSALKLESFHYPEASYNLGRLYAARGQNDLAVREWRRVLALDPEHKAAAEALSRVGSEERIVVAPRRVEPPAKPGAEPVVAERSGVSKVSTSSARAPRTLSLDQPGFDLLQRARNSNEKGNTLDAADSYTRLLARQGGYFPPANLELSFTLMSLKRYDEARANLQMVVDRDGARYPISYFHLARVFESQGDLKQAEEFFSRAVSSFSTQNPQFLLDVSRVRELQGNFKGALEAMEQYLHLIKQQGQTPSWSDERLTALREKVSAAPKPV
jgi:tetratricopeptide (TPR) repeat protein